MRKIGYVIGYAIGWAMRMFIVRPARMIWNGIIDFVTEFENCIGIAKGGTDDEGD